MTTATATVAVPILDTRKPLVSEIDVFGLTHTGLVRKSNADQFLVATFHRAMRVHTSSVPGGSFTVFSPDSRGFIALVADGVGGLEHAEDGSAQATNAAARDLVEIGLFLLMGVSEISLEAEPQREGELVERLGKLATQANQNLLAFAERVGSVAATTMTMFIVVWPRVFVVHAGDSRCYRLRDGRLEQLTIDQTMVRAMIDAGAMSREAAEALSLKLIGTSDHHRTDRYFLCTDGLTRYVSDGEIHEKLASDIGSENVCRTLLDLALERGGSDNITVIATRIS